MDIYKDILYLQCRSCGSRNLSTVTDYGHVPLASSLISSQQNINPDFIEQTYPLHCVVCNECTLMQLDFDVNPHEMFIENYHYRASYSDAILEHSKELSQLLVQRYGLTSDDIVLEIGSNDGYFLRWINDGRVKAIGIEPSTGPANDSIALGIETIQEFFDADYAPHFIEKYSKAKLIFMSNVISHTRQTSSVLEGIDKVLTDDGILVIENPWVKDLIDENQFDMIYHEHACYFSCHSLEALLNKVGLYLNDANYVSDLHGGMLVWHASRTPGRSEMLEGYFAQERTVGLDSPQYYLDFGQRIMQTKQRIADVVRRVLDNGGTIAAYGAVAKGVTLLQALGLSNANVKFTVDRNEEKIGYFLPGSRIPVKHVDELIMEKPDVTLLLAWNYKKEIAQQQQQYLLTGAFLVPVPEIELIGSQQYEELFIG